MDAGGIGALIGFSSLLAFFACTALYEKCRRSREQNQTLPVFTSNPQIEPLLLHKQKVSMKQFFGRMGILPSRR